MEHQILVARPEGATRDYAFALTGAAVGQDLRRGKPAAFEELDFGVLRVVCRGQVWTSVDWDVYPSMTRAEAARQWSVLTWPSPVGCAST